MCALSPCGYFPRAVISLAPPVFIASNTLFMVCCKVDLTSRTDGGSDGGNVSCSHLTEQQHDKRHGHDVVREPGGAQHISQGTRQMAHRAVSIVPEECPRITPGIEELAASGDRCPALSRKHGEVGHGGEATNVGRADVVSDVIPSGLIRSAIQSVNWTCACAQSAPGMLPTPRTRCEWFLLPLLSAGVRLREEDDCAHGEDDKANGEGPDTRRAHLLNGGARGGDTFACQRRATQSRATGLQRRLSKVLSTITGIHFIPERSPCASTQHHVPRFAATRAVSCCASELTPGRGPLLRRWRAILSQ